MLLFAIYGGFSVQLGYTLGKLMITEYSDLLNKHKIEYFYTGFNPHVNLQEVSRKLKEEPSIEPSIFLKIKILKSIIYWR